MQPQKVRQYKTFGTDNRWRVKHLHEAPFVQRSSATVDMRMDARSFVDVYFLQQLLKVFLKWIFSFLFSLSLCAGHIRTIVDALISVDVLNCSLLFNPSVMENIPC